jgi:uncharacterized protein VirK/YbjX
MTSDLVNSSLSITLKLLRVAAVRKTAISIDTQIVEQATKLMHALYPWEL